jgi:hypothetical protein
MYLGCMFWNGTVGSYLLALKAVVPLSTVLKTWLRMLGALRPTANCLVYSCTRDYYAKKSSYDGLDDGLLVTEIIDEHVLLSFRIIILLQLLPNTLISLLFMH